jgi:hypothetical protein
MNSNNSTPRIKLSGKHLVGFDTSVRPPAVDAADGDACSAVAKVGAVKLGLPKPGLSRPDR